MLVYPRIQIFSYITNFGHQVGWVIRLGKYRKLQDELTELEFTVYNMRLGTKVDQ